jgi:hypothetical protein
VNLEGTQVTYDYLIVAAGARHSYFGHAEWEALAPGLKTIEDALEIRRRVLLAFELAERDRVTAPDQLSGPPPRVPAPVRIMRTKHYSTGFSTWRLRRRYRWTSR